ncbi:MAG: hypothetical protein K9M12_00310 [Candidatus Pacebacteria bacterium]|nr:hypothetical protein [Candidatus Paceibacterota bacterium]
MEKSGKFLKNKSAFTLLVIVSLLVVGFVYFQFFPIISLLVGFVLVALILAFNSLARVPTVHGAIPTRFGKRVKKKNGEVRILEEGLHLLLPLVDVLEEVFEKKLTTAEVTTEATSKDRIVIKMTGSVQYRPYDLNTYIEMTEDTIKRGMVDTIEDEFGSVCGTKDADDFYQNRAKVAVLIDCVFRLERPPHYYLNEVEVDDNGNAVGVAADEVRKEFGKAPTPEAKKIMGIIVSRKDIDRWKRMTSDQVLIGKLETIRKKLDPNEWNLKKEGGEIDLIAFYNDNIGRINLLFELDDIVPEEKFSPTEKLYGIKVARFKMARVDFSEEVQRAFEQERSSVAKMGAAEIRFKKKKQMIRGYIKSGISPELAVNLVETTAGERVDRKIVSVEGSKGGGVDLLAFAKTIADGSGNSGGGTPPANRSSEVPFSAEERKKMIKRANL